MMSTAVKMIISCLLFTCFNSQAAIIAVNDPTDDGQIDGLCDLRDAINAANFNLAVDGCAAGEAGVQDVVIIQVAGPIQLDSAIAVFGAITVATNPAAPAVRIIAADERRHFRVNPNSFDDSNFSMANLILSGGDAGSGDGGAIWFDSTNTRYDRIELNGMVFEDNRAFNGGALMFNNVQANYFSVINSEFINNTATNYAGAINADRMVLPGATPSSIDISHNLFLNNQSLASVGAVYLGNQGAANLTTTLQDNQFINNHAADDVGALQLNGIVTPWNVQISESLWLFNQSVDQVGAIAVYSEVIANVSNSVIAFNSAGLGGGIGIRFDDALVNLSNSTLTHNQATSTGDNIYVYSTGRITLRSNIIANPINGDNCTGSLGTTPSTSSNNIADDSSCELLNTASLTTIADPKLSGFSAAMDSFPGLQPAVDSPAIDTSNCNLLTDAIGNTRPLDGDGDNQAFCDVGGLEAPANTDLIWRDAFGF